MAVCFGGKKSKTSQSISKHSSSIKHNNLNHENTLSASKHSTMPHDLSHSSANSASSSALSYSYGTSRSTSPPPNNHHFHKKAEQMDMSDDDSIPDDNDSKQQKKLKRTLESSAAAPKKHAVVNADMVFYCFEILGNHLFNGKHHLGKHHASSSATNGQLVPSTVTPPQVPSEHYPLFVSWFIGTDKQLRGCIGTFSPMDLAHGLREYALTSALNDSRFSPISRDEYPMLHCAVSILTQFEPCSHYSDWVIGLHGIRIEFLNERGSRRSATYLPEVAHEQGWNHVQTLDSLLRKGGYRAPITSDMRKSVQVTRYQSEKLTLHYNDYVQYKTTSSVTTISNVLIDDESSRLKHFIWEELAENFYVAVIFRSGRRYVVQRHFEQQLLDIKSSFLQNKWRHCLYDVIHKSHAPIYITCHEVELMHEIFSWHLNYTKNYLKLRENVDYIVNFEDLVDNFQSLTSNDSYLSKPSIIQPVTTLDAARKNIELWKNLQENVSRTELNEDIHKSINDKQPVLTSSSTGWLQLDSKIVPFIKKQCDHLLLVDILLQERVINSSEDVSLRSLYIPIQSEDIDLFHTLLDRSSLTIHSLLITLDHLIFRLKRLFFIKFLSTQNPKQSIDHQKIMSNHGGLITLDNRSQQRIPFIYINRMRYIPQLNHLNFTSISTFCMANQYELEYLRLISLYDYLSSDENKETLESLSSTNNLTLIPITSTDEYQIQLSISLQDFHDHEYERRTQQERNLKFYDNDGWWQPPLSSSTTRQKRTFSHFKLQRPIFF